MPLRQLVLAHLIVSGELERHIRLIRERQRTGAMPCSPPSAGTCSERVQSGWREEARVSSPGLSSTVTRHFGSRIGASR